MKIRLIERFIGCALILGGLALCAKAGENPRFNVVILLADDMRPDAPGVYGNPDIATPHIDRLAARGARFTRATCSYPICNVSRSEMFAGRLNIAADLPRGPMGGLQFPKTWTLYPTHFKELGWHTIYTGKWHVGGTAWTNGFAETAGLYSSGGGPEGVRATFPTTVTGRTVTGYSGYTFKDDKNKPLPELGIGLTPATDRIMTDRAVEAIRRVAGKPFFLQVNFTAPHDPLHWPEGRENARDYRKMKLPENFRPAHPFDTGNVTGRDEVVVPPPRSADDVKKERAIYFTQIEQVDRQIGRVVAALKETGQLERTIVIVTSDHGLAMGSHGLMGKQNQYEHSINVSLVMAGPGIPAGKVFDAQCYLRDLYPTLCDLTGVPIPASVQARSLAPVLRGKKAEIYDEIFGYYTNTQRMVRHTDGWKLIHYPQINRYQLFNVRADPSELRDLADDPAQASRLKRMKAQLSSWQKENKDPLVVAKAVR